MRETKQPSPFAQSPPTTAQNEPANIQPLWWHGWKWNGKKWERRRPFAEHPVLTLSMMSIEDWR
jgi:hypothetical protein